jgi:hypothetical protein
VDILGRYVFRYPSPLHLFDCIPFLAVTVHYSVIAILEFYSFEGRNGIIYQDYKWIFP